MVDGVNFNPFAGGRVWTSEEIEKLDADKNGVVSYQEMQANVSWLTGESVDDEGEIQIGDDASSKPGETQQTGASQPSVVLSDNESAIYGAAAKNGVQDSAADSSQLQQYMNTIIDSYVEQYMQKNPGLEQNQKSSLITFIKTEGQEFVNNYLQNNTAVPYDTQAVAQSLIQTLDSAVQQRNDLATDVNNQINDLKNNVDANYDKLSSTTNAADDDYVTSSEFQQMKDEAVNYLLGTMLNGEADAEFLANINAQYSNDPNYKIAMASVNSINNETDPAKIQEFLEQAKTALGNLIGTQNVDGTSNLNNAVLSKDVSVAEAEKAEQKAQYSEALTSTIDKMVESYSNEMRGTHGIRKHIAAHSADDVQQYKTLLTNIMNKFLDTYEGDGSDLETAFRQYADSAIQDSNSVQNELNGIKSTHSADAMAKLESVVNSTGTYISEDESQQIIDYTVDFVLNQLTQGITDISLLSQISPEYASNEKFTEAKTLLDGIATSATPKEDMEKIRQLLGDMMKEIGAEKIADGVKNREMPQVTFSDEEMANLKALFPGYDFNQTISSDTYKGKDCSGQARDNLQDKAREMLQNMKPQLMNIIKDKMGADFDYDTANKLVDDAIYQTINDITDMMNIDHTNRIIKKKRKWTATISTQQLVDTFMTNFLNNSAKDAAPEPGTNPVDRESVMRNTSLADRYQDKASIKVRGSKMAELVAKSQIQIIAAQLKAQLMSELGSNYDSNKINSLIDQATSETLKSVANTKGALNRYTINTNTIANTFFDTFDKLYSDTYKTA